MSESAVSLLGLTEYEARVYRALLEEGPATAYRLGKRSGVPLSRVYDIAGQLVQKSAAVTEPGVPVRYSPMDPADLIDAARSRANRGRELLGAGLTALRG